MEMTRGKIIGLSVVGAIILLVIVYFIYRPKTTTGTPPIDVPTGTTTTTTTTQELPPCDIVNKTCRSKCINKWWIPVVGITEYQKCMDKCKAGNPCL